MNAKFLVLFCLSFALNHTARAAALSDLNSETEDLINESDAAVADTKDYKQHTAKEKAQATQRHDVANKALKAAAAKRQKAVDEMHATEAEIARLNAEQVKFKADAVRLESEGVQADKLAQENRAKIEKMKTDLATIKQLRAEKAQKYIEIAGERDKTIADLKVVDEERVRVETDFQQAKAQEKAANDQLAKLKQDYNQKKAKLDAYIAGLKERYRHAVDRQAQVDAEKAEMERNALKLEAQAKAGEAEVAQAENPQAAVAQPPAAEPQPVAESMASAAAAVRSPTSADLTFKRKCRVFDGPVRGSNVVAVQESGMSVAKFNEGKEWISFLLQDGRKAFAAKNCFR